jgi:SAM-dependent methyltransferase
MAELNLGCGADRFPGVFGLDIARTPATDLLADFGRGLPIKSNSVSKVYAWHLLEHVDHIALLREIHRILEPGGVLHLRVPHASSMEAWGDPTHRRPFTSKSFDYFDASAFHGYYFDFNFKVRKKRLNFLANRERNRLKLLPWLTYPLMGFLEGLANRNLKLCEMLWCHWVGGFQEVEAWLEKPA